MMISSRGKYALQVIIDMAENASGDYIPLKDVAQRQGLSQKYMEGIMATLSRNKLVDGVHGKGGGYRLNRRPEEYAVGEILRLTEKSLAPVACHKGSCQRAAQCRTLPLWNKLDTMINTYLDSVTIADLMLPGQGKR